MTDGQNEQKPVPKAVAKRRERLANELRSNLKKRKARARAIDGAAGPSALAAGTVAADPDDPASG